ncbi:class II aldolase/adducin family protein [Aquabacterium sp. J223]|uniref:class II aldolase/adducin family protein n=1 Tax=Aquabacterium sp. J223 TaxID=2898431 RepID=UPI0021AE01EC|nr:class II aldolase/adducin family protein [Aquabacterium sp. J223]UUX95325.1 class II aldolase/adducin family protein [Aquabacterium sp. J223]
MSRPSNMGDAEWQARIDLAATYRLCVHYGWDNLIYNHIALRVPDEPGHFLFKRHQVMFDEVCASNLVKIELRGKALSEDDGVNAAGFTIHTAILNARPDLHCTLHVHSKAGMAMSANAEGLLPMTQGAMRFYDRLAYHDYEGIATDLDEASRLARDLGPRHKSMILRNHGLLTCGTSASEALTLMRYLVGACETQLMLQATGCRIVLPSAETCEHAARQWERHDAHGGQDDWPAYLRIADRLDPSYRT